MSKIYLSIFNFLRPIFDWKLFFRNQFQLISKYENLSRLSSQECILYSYCDCIIWISDADHACILKKSNSKAVISGILREGEYVLDVFTVLSHQFLFWASFSVPVWFFRWLLFSLFANSVDIWPFQPLKKLFLAFKQTL